MSFKIKEDFKGNFIHFNSAENTIEYLKAGDSIEPTKKDIDRFPQIIEKTNPPTREKAKKTNKEGASNGNS